MKNETVEITADIAAAIAAATEKTGLSPNTIVKLAITLGLARMEEEAGG